jgi:hypothetical protein
VADSPENKSMTAVAGELWQLVVAYIKQETIEPMKGLLRFVAAGAGAMFCLGIGSVLLLLALLRVLQTETGTAFDGNWSVLPYVIVFFAALLIAMLAVRAIGAEKRRSERASGRTS